MCNCKSNVMSNCAGSTCNCKSQFPTCNKNNDEPHCNFMTTHPIQSQFNKNAGLDGSQLTLPYPFGRKMGNLDGGVDASDVAFAADADAAIAKQNAAKTSDKGFLTTVEDFFNNGTAGNVAKTATGVVNDLKNGNTTNSSANNSSYSASLTGETGSNTMIWVIGGMVVLAIIGVVIFAVVKKK